MIANVISSPTFRHLKVSELKIDEQIKFANDFNYNHRLDDVSSLDEAFEDISYGVSDELNQNLINSANVKNFIKINNNEKISLKYEIEKNSEISEITKIQIEEGGKSEIDISYINNSGDNAQLNSLILIYAKKNTGGDIHITNLLNDNDKAFQGVAIILEDGANINLYHSELGAGKKAMNFQSYLRGENSNLKIEGMYLLNGEKKLDLLYNSVISGKSSKSHTTIKGAQLDSSKKTFKGTVDFRRGSSGSEGDISETVTLLDEKVVSRSLPILLCQEEDVKGSHAASAGKIDEDMLFYIMSRGYSLNEAKSLIVFANLLPLIDKNPDEKIRKKAMNFIEKKMGA